MTILSLFRSCALRVIREHPFHSDRSDRSDRTTSTIVLSECSSKENRRHTSPIYHKDYDWLTYSILFPTTCDFVRRVSLLSRINFWTRWIYSQLTICIHSTSIQTCRQSEINQVPASRGPCLSNLPLECQLAPLIQIQSPTVPKPKVAEHQT
jgi:hypothetical protein